MEPYQGTGLVVASIDASGSVSLLVNGSPQRVRLASLEDARTFVGETALDLAERTGRVVTLHSADPAGAWMFEAKPDGSMVEAPDPSIDAGTSGDGSPSRSKPKSRGGSSAAASNSPMATTRPLGAEGTVACSIAVTEDPRTLPIDCLVVAVGDRLGRLGSAMMRAAPDPAWGTVDFDAISPEQPHWIELREATDIGSSGDIRSVVLATPRASPDARATPEAAAVATAAAVVLAAQVGSRSVGLPLLSIGRLQGSSRGLAAAAVPAVRGALRRLSAVHHLEQIVFVCDDDQSVEDIVRAWVEDAVAPLSSTLDDATKDDADAPVLPLAPEALRLIELAAKISQHRQGRSVTGDDVVLATLVRALDPRLDLQDLRNDAAAELTSSVVGLSERLPRALEAVGVPNGWLPILTDAEFAVDTDELSHAASQLATILGQSEISSHHLLTAALSEQLNAEMLTVLERTQNQLRSDLLTGVSRLPDRGPNAVWDAVLAPRLGVYQRQGIGSDVWTREDRLGYAIYADAIARGIQHHSTRSPLTIGIKAPWGAGKTSLMRMVQDRLEWPDAHLQVAPERAHRRIELTNSSVARLRRETGALLGKEFSLRPVTNRVVLAALARVGAPTTERSEDGGGEKGVAQITAEPAAEGLRAGAVETSEAAAAERWRPTVWFNPWMYQSGEQVWAGLAHEIITQVTDRMSRKEREYFWLHLNRSRVDAQAVRRKVYQLLFERLVPVVLFAVVVLLGGLLALLVAGWDRVGALLLGLGPLALVAGGVAAWHKVVSLPAAATFTRLLSAGSQVRGPAAEALAGTYEPLVDAPDYRNKTGFFYLMHSDLKRVLALVTTKERPMVIFVDDLDRCSPATVVQVIEAINLFLAGQLPNCIFVLAMDPAVVAKHIETAYEGLAERLTEESGVNSAQGELGWRFLEKIVQLPLTLPAMEESLRESFYTQLFVDEQGPRGMERIAASAAEAEEAALSPGDGRTALVEIDEAAVDRAKSMLSYVPIAQVGTVSGRVAPGAAGEVAARRIVDEALSGRSPAVRDAVALARQHLSANPREIKRFVNLFRFLVMINDERGRKGQEAAPSLDCLAKVAVLSLRWPALMERLGSSGSVSDVLALVERDPGPTQEAGDGGERAIGHTSDDRLQGELRRRGLSEVTIKELTDEQFAAFVRAEPLVSSAARGLL